MDATAVLRPAKSRLDLVERRLERGVEVVATCLGTHDRALAGRGEFHLLTHLGLPTISFVVELDVESEDRWVIPLETGELVADVDAVMLWDLDVAALEHDGGVRFGRFLRLDGAGRQHEGRRGVVVVDRGDT